MKGNDSTDQGKKTYTKLKCMENGFALA